MTEPGRRLFALLGRLPHGLAREDLAAVMPDEGEAAAAALPATGLVLPDAERLRLLAPVRAFAAEQRAPERDLAALTARFAALADALPWAMEMPADPATAARARAELANIEAVLGEQDATGDVDGARPPRVAMDRRRRCPPDPGQRHSGFACISTGKNCKFDL